MRRFIYSAGFLIIVIVCAIGGSWLVYMPDNHERGAWQAQSGNMVLSLGRFKADVYGASSHSCGKLFTFPAHMKVVELLEGALVRMIGENLQLTIDGQLDPSVFDRLDAVPAACLDPMSPTPRNVFDAMWTAMDEHYAFFDLHGIDWQARRALAPEQDAQMSGADLFALLQDALRGLDDGHIQIGTPDLGVFSPKERAVWLPQSSPLDREGLLSSARANVGVALLPLPNTSIEYGLREDGLDYILIREMNVTRALGQTSEHAMEMLFAPLAAILSNAEGIVIDVRYNPGGSDPVSLGIASHFTDVPLTVFTKSSRVGDGQYVPFEAVLRPHGADPLTMPVIVLTSNLTASAAEIFTIAMRELPQVTTMGEPTSGGLSDILGFVLPNGWSFGLSNQTYLTNDRSLYEAVGVPPDIQLPFVAADFAAGNDPVLAAAFARLSAVE